MAVLTPPTIEDLIINIRNLLRQPRQDNSTWTDEELITYVNEGIRRYFTEVVVKNEGQFLATANLDLVSGEEAVELPSDFFGLRAVYRKVTDGYQVMPYVPDVNRSFSTISGTSGESYVPAYYMRKQSLVLRPPPTFSETDGLRIEYVAFPETILTGGDSMTASVSPIFKDLIETYAAYKAKVVESSTNGVNTYAPLKENLQDLMLAFRESIQNRAIYPNYIIPFNPEGN